MKVNGIDLLCGAVDGETWFNEAAALIDADHHMNKPSDSNRDQTPCADCAARGI